MKIFRISESDLALVKLAVSNSLFNLLALAFSRVQGTPPPSDAELMEKACLSGQYSDLIRARGALARVEEWDRSPGADEAQQRFVELETRVILEEQSDTWRVPGREVLRPFWLTPEELEEALGFARLRVQHHVLNDNAWAMDAWLPVYRALLEEQGRRGGRRPGG